MKFKEETHHKTLNIAKHSNTPTLLFTKSKAKNYLYNDEKMSMYRRRDPSGRDFA